MSNKHFAPKFKTFTWLRDHHTIDGKCERVLKMISKRYKRVLVAGNTDSGKNTVSNAIYAYWQEIGRQACYTPSVTCKTPGGLWSNTTWKNYRTLFTSGQAVITPMMYEQEFYGEQFVPGLFNSAKHFDVVVDCRRLPDGSRIVAQVFCRRGTSWTCLYRSNTFASLQIGKAA
jgi:Flp pilus assembly CpaF family ATPase